MKKLILALTLITRQSLYSQAQEKPLSPADYKDNIGKVVTLCDTVYNVRILSDTLTLLNMGGSYPHHKFTIAIKGNKVQLDWVNLKKKHLCVTGTLLQVKNEWQIEAAQPKQISISK